MSRTRILLRVSLLAVAALAAVGAAPGPALASHTQSTYFEGASVLLNPATRARGLTQIASLGVRALRVELYWHDVAPKANSASRPSVDLTSPESYNWGQYDPLLAEAKRLGWQVLLTVAPPAPRWATSNLKAPYVTRPDDLDFQHFMTAVGRHFAGEVSLYSIWNEPNHPYYLRPQFNANGTPASPRIYRGLFQAGYAGLQAAGIASPKVLIGETAPTGYDSVSPREGLIHDVAPLAFLRGVLCLNSHYQRSSSCAKLQASGYAHHAYTTAAGPLYQPPNPDDVTLGVLGRLSHALALAARAGALPGGLPIYMTEFGIESKPNKYLGVPVEQQAEWDAIAERIAWANPQVAGFSQYLLKDDPLGGPFTSTGFIGFQTGLLYVNGAPKPLYYGFRLPLVVARQGSGFQLWGLVRPATGPSTVTVMIQMPGSSRYRMLARVATNSRGYWTLRSSTRGAHWRVRWSSPSGVRYEGPPIRAY